LLGALDQGRTVVVGALAPEDTLAIEMLSRVCPLLRLLPGIGSWNGCYHWIPDAPLFQSLPAGNMAGEEWVDVLPHYVLAGMGGQILAGSFTTTTQRTEEKHVLWFSDAEIVRAGKGKIIFCQLRIFNQNPDQPMAMQLAYNLLRMTVENCEETCVNPYR
jgi:hypothetical protein